MPNSVFDLNPGGCSLRSTVLHSLALGASPRSRLPSQAKETG